MLSKTLFCVISFLAVFAIIQIIPVFGYADDDVDIILSTDKASYKHGDFVTIKGSGAHSYTIFTTIISPQGEEIADLKFIAASNGDFSTVWIIPNGIEQGTYTIHVEDVIKKAQTTFQLGTINISQDVQHSPDTKLKIPAEKSKLPDWIKNIFVWYGQGQISEDDVLGAIKFLVANQIIEIDVANQSMGMMNQDMMKQNMSFNVDVPIIIPMIDGYHNRNMVYFVHTEVSDFAMANMMSKMINFPTLHVPELKNIPENKMAKVYVFTNGVSGSEPYGGGPFMYQIDVFDSIPGQAEYSQFRIPYLVTWNDDSKPRILTLESAILKAESADELTIEKSTLVVNVPIITWEMQGSYGKTMEKISTIPRMFESMPGVEGELTFFDEKNYVAIFKLHSEKSIDMMKMNR